ncbi:MAG: GNAT family N-acetyltransferase [Pseudomonadota bacterium]
MASITPADSAAEIAIITRLAERIWNEHYSTIISQQQIDYMLERFQSAAAIQQQIDADTRYFLINIDAARPVGYLSLVPDSTHGRLQISKIYVDAAHRGRGFGKQALDFTEKQCRSMHIINMWLTVNKNNHIAIKAYQRWGFHTTESIVTDIGQGFVMDDFIMEKSVDA